MLEELLGVAPQENHSRGHRPNNKTMLTKRGIMTKVVSKAHL